VLSNEQEELVLFKVVGLTVTVGQRQVALTVFPGPVKVMVSESQLTKRVTCVVCPGVNVPLAGVIFAEPVLDAVHARFPCELEDSVSVTVHKKASLCHGQTLGNKYVGPAISMGGMGVGEGVGVQLHATDAVLLF
jgi:hypothetical protein